MLSQQFMIRQTVLVMLHDASVERLEEIGSKGYDQTVVDNETLSSSADLSSRDSA